MFHSNYASDLTQASDLGNPFDDIAGDVLSLSAASQPFMSGATATPGMALYLTEPGTTAAISVADLHQGQIGDCYLISSIGELALTKPVDISNMIHTNADGTETVRLYADQSGHAIGWGTTVFKAVSVTVSNVFPNYAVNNGAN